MRTFPDDENYSVSFIATQILSTCKLMRKNASSCEAEKNPTTS